MKARSLGRWSPGGAFAKRFRSSRLATPCSRRSSDLFAPPARSRWRGVLPKAPALRYASVFSTSSHAHHEQQVERVRVPAVVSAPSPGARDSASASAVRHALRTRAALCGARNVRRLVDGGRRRASQALANNRVRSTSLSSASCRWPSSCRSMPSGAQMTAVEVVAEVGEDRPPRQRDRRDELICCGSRRGRCVAAHAYTDPCRLSARR